MPNYLFVGGAYDGQSVPVTDDQLEARLLPSTPQISKSTSATHSQSASTSPSRSTDMRN